MIESVRSIFGMKLNKESRRVPLKALCQCHFGRPFCYNDV